MSNKAEITVTTCVYDMHATPAAIGELEYHHSICHLTSDTIVDMIRNGKSARAMLNCMNYISIQGGEGGAKITAYGDAQRGGIEYLLNHLLIKPTDHVTVESENGKITLRAHTDVYGYVAETKVTIRL